MPRGDSGASRTSNSWWREAVRSYINKPIEERKPLKEWLREHNMKRPTFERIIGWNMCEDSIRSQNSPSSREVMELMQEDLIPTDPELRGEYEHTQLVRQIKELDDAVHTAATKNRIARMAELAYARLEKKMGEKLLPEKVDQKVEVDVNIAQYALNAVRQFENERVEGDGVAEVSKRYIPLSTALRLDTGQGEEGDS